MSEWSDGEYPTEAALERIQSWPITSFGDCRGLMEFIQPLWWASEWGWHEEIGKDLDGFAHALPAHVYHLSTGGWSGNESIIAAMRGNQMFWMIAWYSSRRGGHFEFRIQCERIAEGQG